MTVVNKTYRLYRPRPWQQAIHTAVAQAGDNTGHIFVVKSKRQIGKTLAVENEILRYALTHAGTTVMCISPTLAQGRKIFDQLIRACRKTDAITDANATLLTLKCINGSQILLKSAQQGDGIRGYTVDYMLIDECAFLPEEFINILLPLTDVKRANILMTSTPRYRAGLFYQYWCYGQDSQYPHIQALDLCEWDTSEFLPADRLEFYRRSMPQVTFTQEYLGEFADTNSVIFGDFRDAVRAPSVRFEDSPALYGGFDFGAGRGEDYTVLTFFNGNGEEVYQWAANDMTALQVARKVARELYPYRDRIRSIYAESNSIGRPYIELIRMEAPWLSITECTTTNAVKADMVANLQAGFERGDVSLLDDREQTNQLASYGYEYNPQTGCVTYNAPLGMHDDRVMSLMYAHRCWREAGRTGNYTIISNR